MPGRYTGILILLPLLLCLIALFVAAIAGIDPPSSQAPAQTPTPTPTPTPTAAPSVQQPTPVASPFPAFLRDGMTQTFGLQDRLTKLVEVFLPLLLGLLALGLLLYAIAETREYRIEFDTLRNGTGEASFGEAMGGMDALIREKLLSKIRILLETIKKYSNLTSEGAKFPPQRSLPQDGNITGTLDKVVEALGDDSPKYLKPLLALWRHIFPGQGSRIRMTFQHDGDPASHVGISFEFIDLRSQRTTKVFTVWEEDPLEITVQPWVLCQPEKAPKEDEDKEGQEDSEQGTEAEEADRIPWSRRVAQALVDASLYEDAITYYEKALAENETEPETTAELVDCQNKLARRAGLVAAFETAARLEESELLEAAAESYARVFPKEPQITSARQQWRIALGLSEGLNGAALDQLAGDYLRELDLHEQAIGLYKRAVQEGNADSVKTLQDLQQKQADALVTASHYLLQNEQWTAAETYLAKAVENVPDHPDALRLQKQLKASHPSQENKEALAAFAVGSIYLERGDPASAKAYFVKALEKQPDYKAAQEALDQLLEQTRSLRRRFTDLLENAMVWLAVELFRQETERMTTDNFRKAQYHNFYGAYLMSLYENYPSASCLTEADLLEAIRRAPGWLLPYEYLGDLHTLRAMHEAEPTPAGHNLKKAIAWYETALTKNVFHSSIHFSPIPDTIKHRIQMDRDAVELLTCPKDGVPGLWENVRKAESHIRLEKETLEDTPISRDFEELYFSLAQLYGLVFYRDQKTGDNCGFPHSEKARARASFYLACAGCVEKNRIAEALYSPILLEVFTPEEFGDLLVQVEITHFQHEAKQARAEEKEKPLTWRDVLKVLEKAGFTIPNDFLEEV